MVPRRLKKQMQERGELPSEEESVEEDKEKEFTNESQKNSNTAEESLEDLDKDSTDSENDT